MAKENSYLVYTYPHQDDEIASYKTDLQNRLDKDTKDRQSFFASRVSLPMPTNVAGNNAIMNISSNLKFWANNMSWTFCATCNSLSTKILPYNFTSKPANSIKKNCVCTQSRYIIPRYKNIPDPLLNLSVEDINVLRPFNVFLEDQERQSHGYKVKTSHVNLRISEPSVEQKIRNLTDETQQLRCRNAYEWLMNCPQSQYSHFVGLREIYSKQGKNINLFNFQETMGIECALWPSYTLSHIGVKVQFQARNQG